MSNIDHKKIIAEMTQEVESQIEIKNIVKESTMPDGTPTGETMLLRMIDNISGVDLVDTLQGKLKDPLHKYRSKDDPNEVDELKVPEAIYQVAISYEINEAARTQETKIARKDENFYVYNGVYWTAVTDEKISELASEAAIKMDYYSPAGARKSNFRRQLVAQMLSDAAVIKKASRKDTVTKVNVLNGTLVFDKDGFKIREHDHNDFMLYSLPFEYDPKATAPIFMRYLNRVLPDIESQAVLQEFLGYVFTHHLKLEKALVLLGSGSNGKSVMFEIMRELFGEHNVLTKSLGDLTDSDAGNDARAKLENKLINYGSEIRAKDIDSDIFKRLVSGEPVAAREKYKTGIDVENHCKLIFNANILPKGAERTHAYFRRFLIVPFMETISDAEKDVELHSKIISAELPGVLNWVLDGLTRLLKNKAFTECAAANAALEQYKKDSDPVGQFCEEYGYEQGEDEFVLSAKLYDDYREWCRDSGHSPLNKRNFSNELIASGFENKRKKSGRGFLVKGDAVTQGDAKNKPFSRGTNQGGN